VYANDLFQLATGNMKSTSTNEPIISVSGLRGTIGDQLTPMVAARYVAAFASRLPPGTLVIGRDGRSSGQMLSQAVSATLAAHGMQTLDQCLSELVKRGQITKADARMKAHSKETFM
jgi:Tfp pilus assembly ATPase PilU